MGDIYYLPGGRVRTANDSCRTATDPHPTQASTQEDPFWQFSTSTQKR
jgi:hypothetical protein